MEISLKNNIEICFVLCFQVWNQVFSVQIYIIFITIILLRTLRNGTIIKRMPSGILKFYPKDTYSNYL